MKKLEYLILLRSSNYVDTYPCSVLTAKAKQIKSIGKVNMIQRLNKIWLTTLRRPCQMGPLKI